MYVITELMDTKNFIRYSELKKVKLYNKIDHLCAHDYL
jgi:hypothetical protein